MQSCRSHWLKIQLSSVSKIETTLSIRAAPPAERDVKCAADLIVSSSISLPLFTTTASYSPIQVPHHFRLLNYY